MSEQVTAPTGLELAVGAEVSIGEEFLSELSGNGLGEATPRADAFASGENTPDIWLLIGGVALLGAASLAFADKATAVPRGVSILLAVVVLAALGLFWVGVRSEARELEAMGFEVKAGIGLWIAAIATLVGGGSELARPGAPPAPRPPTPRRSRSYAAANQPPTPSAENASTPSPPDPRPLFCVQCGNRHRELDRYCGSCGSPRDE